MTLARLLPAFLLLVAPAARAQDLETPSPEPAPLTPEEQAALASLALAEETITPAAESARIDFYGFADLNFWKPLVEKDNPWLAAFPTYSTFAVGNLNLYMDAHLAPRWRSLIEVRFLYSPHGDQVLQPDGRITIVDNRVMDPVEFGRRVTWGGIAIERAWIEFQLHQYLTIRAGQFLTPYGIWNVDHGSPTLIGIRRPYVIREALLPERQTGIELYGIRDWNNVHAGYHLTLSNGRGPVPEYKDFDDDKAIGGRLYAQVRKPADVTLGFSWYYGKNTDRTYRWVPTGMSITRQMSGLSRNTDLSLAADLRLRFRGLLVQSEFAMHDKVFSEAGRPMATGAAGRFIPDYRRTGGYVLAGYRTPFFGLVPYAAVDYYRPGGPGESTAAVGDIPTVWVYFAGVNVRPTPNIVVKVELGHARFPDAAAGSWGRHPFTMLQAQTAWAF